MSRYGSELTSVAEIAVANLSYGPNINGDAKVGKCITEPAGNCTCGNGANGEPRRASSIVFGSGYSLDAIRWHPDFAHIPFVGRIFPKCFTPNASGIIRKPPCEMVYSVASCRKDNTGVIVIRLGDTVVRESSETLLRDRSPPFRDNFPSAVA